MILPVIAFIVTVLIVHDSDQIEVKAGKDEKKIERIRDIHGRHK